MARSKTFEALLNEAGKAAKKGGETLSQVAALNNSRTEKRTVTQTVSKSDKQTVKRADSQSNGHTNTQSDKLTSSHTARQSERHSKKQTKEQSERHTIRHSVEIKFDDPFHWMTAKQAKIYSFLVENKSRITSLGEIVKITGIAYGTVRGSLKKLTDENCISKPQRYRRGESQGITYTVNEQICDLFLNHEKHRHTLRQSKRQTHKQSNEQTHSKTDDLSDRSYSSSSSSLNKTTTMPDLETILATHPELGYWRQKGITPKQIMEWMKTADCEPDLMIQYLCYCRYEMVDLNMEESKPVNNVFNWFFKIVEKTGCYPKPKGYKSHEQKKLEAEQALIAEREKQIQKLKELHRKKYEQERDLKFWEMMNNPDNDLYRQCFERLNDFAKKKARKGGKVFESAMRKAFDEIWEQ